MLAFQNGCFMKTMFKALLLSLLFSSVIFGETLSVIEGPDTAETEDLVILDASKSTGSYYKWILDTKPLMVIDSVKDGPVSIITGLNSKKLAFSTRNPGDYRFILLVSNYENNNVVTSVTEHVIKISGLGPTPNPIPVPPIPPIPVPPVPPIPPVPVNPPINPTGFTVLFLYESDGSTLTEKQLQIVNSNEIDTYLNSKTVKENRIPAWRKWDNDFTESGTEFPSEMWKKMYLKGKSVLSDKDGIVINTDKEVIVEPMPANTDDTLKLLKKYGE
jgi:hypothetical protein